jgi:telomerase reverse transcriptase
LHNAFTSPIDPRESALPFKDYTLRESEIKKSLLNDSGEADPKKQSKIPKRLCGPPLELVRKLRRLHSRCAYAQLLRYYCALSVSVCYNTVAIANVFQDETVLFMETGPRPSAITDLATPASRVSAFCQSVMKKVVPNAIWGDGEAGEYNKRLILKHVDTFLRARKFESFTLQSFLEGLRIRSMSWLCLPHQVGHSMSQSDFEKRKELLAELIYYLFDSFLIPLVRSNFHVTESNVHRNRLFYFRHDVWQKLCEPALEEFKADLFEELNNKTSKQRLASRTFGYSNVRLLPKVTGFRPITNLRRRPYIWVNGKKMLGKSINSALNPAFRALNHEKVRLPNWLLELRC